MQHASKMKKINYKIDEMVLVFVVLVIIIGVSVQEKGKPLQKADPEKILGLVLKGTSVKDGMMVLDEKKLNELQGMDYNAIKKLLNVKDDFCMYLQDGKGSVLLVKGSPKLSEDGIKCQE
ncbi:MAG TPA: hypothetical protein VJI52_05115 [Candidatus Nanoarchaeia archaeon]|nr:hypothetical protein [Candidatus Nanoarchaeia archaeon]